MTSTVSKDRPRLLLVDDDVGVRETLARLLASEFHVTQAGDGQGGIDCLMLESFDVVVTDLEMPRLGGDDLCDWIAQHQPNLSRRVLVLSGGARDARRGEWLRSLPQDRVLQKPCPIETVVASIRSALDGDG